MILKMDEEFFSRQFRGSAVATLVKVSPMASLLFLAQAPVLVLDPRSEAERADSAGWLVLQVVAVFGHVLVESPGKGLDVQPGRIDGAR